MKESKWPIGQQAEESLSVVIGLSATNSEPNMQSHDSECDSTA